MYRFTRASQFVGRYGCLCRASGSGGSSACCPCCSGKLAKVREAFVETLERIAQSCRAIHIVRESSRVDPVR